MRSLQQGLHTPRSTIWRPHGTDWLDRFAESLAWSIGTAKFILWMTVVMAAWIVWNVAGPGLLRFDPRFRFLTLALSLQSSYAAPLILLAQYRQQQRDNVEIELDRRLRRQYGTDMEFLTKEITSLRGGISGLIPRDAVRQIVRDEVPHDLLQRIVQQRRGKQPAPQRSRSDDAT